MEHRSVFAASAPDGDDFMSFASRLNVAVRNLAAVSYVEVAASIHPGGVAPRKAWGDGVPAEAFARHVVDVENFVTVAEAGSAEVARSYNRLQAAIAEFAYSSEDWHRTATGRYFSNQGDHVLTMKPVYVAESGSWQFGIEASEPHAISHDGEITDLDGIVARKASADIADALSNISAAIELNVTRSL